MVGSIIGDEDNLVGLREMNIHDFFEDGREGKAISGLLNTEATLASEGFIPKQDAGAAVAGIFVVFPSGFVGF